jgi:hypothetical protein
MGWKFCLDCACNGTKHGVPAAFQVAACCNLHVNPLDVASQWMDGYLVGGTYVPGKVRPPGLSRPMTAQRRQEGTPG